MQMQSNANAKQCKSNANAKQCQAGIFQPGTLLTILKDSQSNSGLEYSSPRFPCESLRTHKAIPGWSIPARKCNANANAMQTQNTANAMHSNAMQSFAKAKNERIKVRENRLINPASDPNLPHGLISKARFNRNLIENLEPQ